MLQRVTKTVLLAGLLSGLVISMVQHLTTTPLILEAERYEQTLSENGFAVVLRPVHGDTAEHGGDAAWGPQDGIGRAAYTILANVLFGVGFAALLVGAFVLRGRPMDGRTGTVWGVAGFASVSLAPALGLAPELPGMAAADLTARQGWWLFCALSTAGGLALMAFAKGAVRRALGLLALIAPHALGAPIATAGVSAVPAELAARFAAASLVTAAIFWSLTGWLAGTFFKRGQPAG